MALESPADRVAAFISEMSAWEREAWRAYRQARESEDQTAHEDGVLLSLRPILAEYCVDAHTSVRGLNCYGRPPSWDSSTEQVIQTSGDENTAWVETRRSNRVLDGGRYRYRLRLEGGVWRIAELEHHDGREWQPYALPMLDTKRLAELDAAKRER